jgi:DNA repair protein RecO (recombination protein O)
MMKQRSVMFRSVITEAIVIRRERLGECHKNLSLITSDLGLITATAYGAYKMQSRLRMASEPFMHSRAFLYHNPVKRSYKVTDLEAFETFEGLRQDLARVSAASFWAEVVLRSYGAGETSPVLFRLFLDCLRALDSGAPDCARYITSQFLWRFLALAGYQPDPAVCDGCGARLDSRERVFYEPSSNAFLCHACSLSSSCPVPSGALRYLEATQSLSLEGCAEVRLEERALKALEAFLFSAVHAVLEGELKSYRVLGAMR